MTRYGLTALAVAAGLLAGAPAVRAAEKSNAVTAFGSLQTADAPVVRAQAEAWLKQVGKADPATAEKVAAVWGRAGRSVLDRVADTLALGSPQASQLLAEAANPLAPAPTAVPELITDAKAPAFFRANLAVAYGRALAHRRVYEEALAALDATRAEDVADPAGYLFYRAVCEHGMLKKDQAVQTIDRLIGDVAASPERYKTVSLLMLLDMETWKSKDLGDVARKMENVERRLDLARGGPETQRQQKEIVRRLDEIIKKLENDAKNKSGGGGSPNGGSCPGGGSQPGNGGGANPSAPMQDSTLPTNGGTGTVNQAKLKKLVESWGSLPERERSRMLQDLVQGLSPTHREAIENYFRNLARNAAARRP